MQCKYCASSNVVRFGTFKGEQRWWCKDCRRKFTESSALFKMKTPVEQVASAMSQYYRGMSLDGIQCHLEQEYGNRLSESAIYYWIIRFTKEAIHRAKDFKPTVGDVWIADETVIKVGGRNRWFWDIIDSKSRYLLASHLSDRRTTNDAQTLMEQALERAGKAPKKILTDKLAAYIDGIELTFGADTKHVQSRPFIEGDESTNMIERFHCTLKDRTKVVRGFKNMTTARLLTEGWLVHYNHFKEHSALGNVPPAQKMGNSPFADWADVVKGTQSKPSKPELPKARKVVHDFRKRKRIALRKPESLKGKIYHQATVSSVRLD